MTNTTTDAVNDIIATVPTNVESPVASQPRLTASAYSVWDGSKTTAVRVRIEHSKHNAQATAEMNAFKTALVRAFKDAGLSVFKVKGAGLRFLYCGSMGNPKDGMAWDLEVRS